MVEFAHSQGVKMGIQLAHAGRKASTMRPWDTTRMAEIGEGGWQAVSSTDKAFEGYPVPRALTVAEIAQLVNEFADAARRAVAVGFDVIEIHAAHGYLLHQFYSPVSNDRTDEYGGSFENRIRFLMEVTDTVRAAIGDQVALFVRISATDWVDEGWNLIDSIELAAKLKAAGVDLIDVSSGGAVHNAPIKATPGFQVPFAAAIRKEAGIATAAVGLITEPEQAQYIIETEEADAVFLARAMLRNPRWAMNAAEALGVKIPWSLPLDRGRTI
jgi:2,4-dienoyl-CoA reductase-like NADH-dependent reductase (Old Yellow Enzyme family)